MYSPPNPPPNKTTQKYCKWKGFMFKILFVKDSAASIPSPNQKSVLQSQLAFRNGAGCLAIRLFCQITCGLFSLHNIKAK